MAAKPPQAPTNLSRIWAKLGAIREASKRTWHDGARLGPDPKYFKDPLPLEVFHLAAAEDLPKIALASDSDLGGSSRIDLRLGAPGEADESWAMKGVPYGVFSGRMSLAVREEVQGRVRGGFVGWRTKPMVGVFGPACYNLKRHTHLSIPVRPGGDPRLWPHWMFNIQTKGYEPDSVWSHRLGITGKGELGGGWEECLIPLKQLAHLSRGRLTDRQTYPDLDVITTLGLSLLAAPRVDQDRLTPEQALQARRSPEGVEGEFELAVGPMRGVYKTPHFINFHRPTYYAPPSTLSFYEPPPTVPTLAPSFDEANYRSTLTPTFARGKFPAYEHGYKGPLPGVKQESPRQAVEGGPSTRGMGKDGKPLRAPPSSLAPSKPRTPGLGEPPPPQTTTRKNLALSEEEVARRLEKELGL